MKYIVILGDGMADEPLAQLGDKTPLEVANKPTMDMIASLGEMGTVKTVPDGIAPGSDVANLSVLGYNPNNCYTGRSPLEAASIGVPLGEHDVTFRINLVTLSDDEEYQDKTMVDYSSDEISSTEGAQLIAAIQDAFSNNDIHFYAGTSYRNLMVHGGGSINCKLRPPHDISGKTITQYLPQGDNAELIFDMMRKSYDVLKSHPVNLDRKARGLNPANSIWIWGQGKKPFLDNFYDRHKKNGVIISAVDLLKGIGMCAGMDIIEVPGATGNIHTNFEGKAKAAADALLSGKDFVYLHIEAADECGHRGEVENKVLAIEKIDSVIAYIIGELDKSGEQYSILLLPDHPTPLATKTHTSDPVPYVIYRSGESADRMPRTYTEKQARDTGLFISEGHTLLDRFFGRYR